MADWADLTTGSNYQTGILAAINERTKALAKMYLADQTSLPTGAIHLNTTDGKFKRWDGSAWQDFQWKGGALEADCINGTKIADDSIDSEHYVDGSIDLAHLSADCVSTAKFRGVNAAYLRWRNALNDADVNVLCLSSLDHSRFNALAGKQAQIAVDNSVRWYLDGADTTYFPLVPVGDYDIGTDANRARMLKLSRGVKWPKTVLSLTGTNRAGAAALTLGFNFATTTTNNYCGKLPAGLEGDYVCVYSNDNNADMPNIYPATNEYMNEVQNGKVVHGAGFFIEFYCYQDGRWCCELPNT